MNIKRVVVQVGDEEYIASEGNASLSVVVEQIQWIDAGTNCMCCASGVVIWTLTAGGYTVLQTTQKPQRVDGDNEIRYIFPPLLRLHGTYEEQRAEALRLMVQNGAMQ